MKELLSTNNKQKKKMAEQENKTYDEILSHLICPITHQVYRNPVTLNDGITYEYEAIKIWLSKNKTSPITKKNIVLNKNINYAILNMIQTLEDKGVAFDRYQNYSINEKKGLTFNLLLNLIKSTIYTENTNTTGQRVLLIKENALSILQSSQLIENYLNSANLDIPMLDGRRLLPIHYISEIDRTLFSEEIDTYLYQSIIDRCSNLEIPNRYGYNPIYISSNHNSIVFCILIDKGVSLNPILFKSILSYYTLPKSQIQIKNTEKNKKITRAYNELLTKHILKMLFKLSEKINMFGFLGQDEMTILHYACSRNSVIPELIKKICDQCPGMIQIPAGLNGAYPIHMVADNKELLTYFIVDKKIDINITTTNGENILFFLFNRNPKIVNLSLIHLLEKYGLNFDFVYKQNKITNLALLHANYDVAKYLLQKYSLIAPPIVSIECLVNNWNKEDEENEDEYRPIFKKRTVTEWENLFTLLLKHGYPLDIQSYFHEAYDLFRSCCQYIRHPPIYPFLIGLILSNKEFWGNDTLSILINAYQTNHLIYCNKNKQDIFNAIRIVLHQCIANAIKITNIKDLFDSCFRPDVNMSDILDLLLTYHKHFINDGDEIIDLNKPNKETGNPPIFTASKFNNLKLVNVLLKHGANIHQKNSSEEGIIHIFGIAQKNDHRYIGLDVDLLPLFKRFVQLKVDLYEKDKEGNTIMHHVCSTPSIYFYSHLEILLYILNKNIIDLDLIGPNNDGLYPLHLLCKCADNVKPIRKMINHLSPTMSYLLTNRKTSEQKLFLAISENPFLTKNQKKETFKLLPVN